MGERARSSVMLDVSRLPCDLNAIDLLARLQLKLRQDGRELVLLGSSPELRELIELAGLSEVLAPLKPHISAGAVQRP